LSDLIEPIWKAHYLFRFRRTNDIAAAIAKHPKGQSIKDRPDLKDAIRHGLDAAEERQHEFEKDPRLMSGSPSHEAARVIAERLGIRLD
jgi:hypothetical protein